LSRRLVYRVHAIQRLYERGISLHDARRIIEAGEVIREYGEDRPFPSRLILGRVAARAIHILVADVPTSDVTFVITVYEPETESAMKCPICGVGETREGTATVTLTSGKMTLVFRAVPTAVCDNCGEEFIDEAVSQNLVRMADDAKRLGVQVDVREYAA
jgi:YgiT-type zinc finger domain-containing protein